MSSGRVIERSSEIQRTPRVVMLEGLFDIPPAQRSGEKWSVDLALPEKWNVGLVVGPSGAGKTTVAREIFGDHIAQEWAWPADKSLVDGFPEGMSIKEIVELLSSVGFSSPPSWLRPFRVLSNGEQFRATIARTLAEMRDLAVVDEFTSVVDRAVAKIASAAIQKTVRRRDQRLIAVSCHYDIAEWLEPDWVYQPHINELVVGRHLWRRPPITLEIRRVSTDAWRIFGKHHYLSADLSRSSRCFVGFVDGNPAVFTAVLHHPHAKTALLKREHRTVCLPDYQGVGIGNAMSEYIGSVCRALGFHWLSTTSHPAMIRHRNKSPKWQMIRKPSVANLTRVKGKNQYRPTTRKLGTWSPAVTRLTATFRYIGPPADHGEALRLWGA